jgi:hypothetical protein
VILKALSKSPGARQQSAGELALDLTGLLPELATTASSKRRVPSLPGVPDTVAIHGPAPTRSEPPPPPDTLRSPAQELDPSEIEKTLPIRDEGGEAKPSLDQTLAVPERPGVAPRAKPAAPAPEPKPAVAVQQKNAAFDKTLVLDDSASPAPAAPAVVKPFDKTLQLDQPMPLEPIGDKNPALAKTLPLDPDQAPTLKARKATAEVPEELASAPDRHQAVAASDPPAEEPRPKPVAPLAMAAKEAREVPWWAVVLAIAIASVLIWLVRYLRLGAG